MRKSVSAGERFPHEFETFRELADNLPQIVWVALAGRHPSSTTTGTGTITPVSRSRTPPTQAGGNRFHPEDRRSRECRVAGGASWRHALRHRVPAETRSDGAYRWFLGRALPTAIPRASIVNWFGTCTDIHEQKLAQQALRGARDKIRRENRQKDEFLGMVSHELRTPLNAVFGWTRLMQENVLNDEERAEAVNSIMRNAEAQARLIEDVLDITRIMNQKLSLDREILNLLDVVADAVEAMRPHADSKHIELETAFESDDLLVEADRMRLAAGDPESPRQCCEIHAGRRQGAFARGAGARLRAARDHPIPAKASARICCRTSSTAFARATAARRVSTAASVSG